jgi:antibiotic biosynthesis monooxygenase (ABM) superfamily enzyme
MIYITQLIFVNEGKEEQFLEFERFAIPLMAKYTGKVIHRIRPTKENFIDSVGETPYEIHFLSFDTQQDLNRFMSDDDRLKFIHLKEASVKSTFLVKGEKM